MDEYRAQILHALVAEMLFLCKRARPDVQTAVAFLTTRVKDADKDDWEKLARCVKYLRHSKNLVLHLGWNKDVIHTEIDAAFAVHPNMRSQTGVYMTMGRGAAYASSIKQKMNTRSSTEAELVAVDDALPQVLWINKFMEAHGYSISDSVVYQDNLSSMLLAKHGKGSSSRRTRHLDIRYFFIQDKIKSKEVSMVHKPSVELTADFFTKPLQGKQFNMFRDRIMGLEKQ